MRNILLLIVAFVFVSLSGCGDQDAGNTSGNENAPETENQPDPETVPMPDTRRYRDVNAGYSFRYPAGIQMNNEGDEMTVLAEAIPVEQLDINEHGISAETASADAAALAEGKFGTGEDLALQSSKTTRRIGKSTAQDFAVLTAGDPCNVVFRRKLVFFKDGYRVAITVSGPKSPILDMSTDYFTQDAENCGTDFRWKSDESQNAFWQSLFADAGGPMGDWMATFEEVAGSVELK